MANILYKTATNMNKYMLVFRLFLIIFEDINPHNESRLVACCTHGLTSKNYSSFLYYVNKRHIINTEISGTKIRRPDQSSTRIISFFIGKCATIF